MTEQTANIYSKSQTVGLQASYRQDFVDLNGDVEGRIAAQNYLDGSTAVYHGQVVGLGFLPKIYDLPAMQNFDSIVDTTYKILEKVTEHYIANPDYRKLFGFSPLLERLICLPTGYQSAIPITRIDIFFDENTGDFKFCEFNTDGSSAMNEDREICNALALSDTYKRFAGKSNLQAQELFDNWVESFMDIYNSSTMAIPQPTIAILDYQQSSIPHEHQEFRRRFEQAGYQALVVDIANLEWHDGSLFVRDGGGGNDDDGASTVKIDAIYRRAVTFEIINELEGKSAEQVENILDGKAYDEFLTGALALLQAVVSQKVCMIGGFKTQVAHSKAIYCALHLQETQDFLSTRERDFVSQHLPYTTWLDSRYISLNEVKQNKDQWIIKPVDGYGTVGVFAGKALTQSEWDDLIVKHWQAGYIVQEYCQQFQTLNTLPVPVDNKFRPLFTSLKDFEMAINNAAFNPTDLQPYNILTGLFCYDGRFRGTYIRSGQHALIVGFHGGITLGTLLADWPVDSGLAVVPRAI